MVPVDADGKRGLFLQEQLIHLHIENTQKTIACLLRNLSVISHWIFHNTAFHFWHQI